MNRLRLAFQVSFVAALLLAPLLSLSAIAQSGGGYDLSWSTIDGGGYTFSAGGSYTLGGTAGQADAGILQGGSFALGGGFWGGGGAIWYGIYLPVILRER